MEWVDDMDDAADPIVGTWYLRRDKGQVFQVVAWDEAAGLADAQHFDGDLEEIGLDAWHGLSAEPIEAPADWSGPWDVGKTDDLTGTGITDTAEADGSGPLDELTKPGLDHDTGGCVDLGRAAPGHQLPASGPAVAGSQEEDAERSPIPATPEAWTLN